MKKVLLLSLAVMLIASTAFGQAGFIGLWSDAGASNCFADASIFGIVTIYVIHMNTPGASGAQFLVVDDAGLAPTFWLSDSYTAGVFNIANSHAGLALSYNACVVSPFQSMVMSYFAQSTTTPCVKTEVIPDPAAASGNIDIPDCTAPIPVKLKGGGSILYWNGNNTDCPCGPVVGVEETSWGQIKSLYRN
jgi:hypothetical protein